MDKINLIEKLNPETVARLQVCLPFMQSDLSYGRGRAKEALAALRNADRSASQATLNNDINRLKRIGVTSLSHIDFAELGISEPTGTSKGKKSKPARKKGAKKTGRVSTLDDKIAELEAEIAEKTKDLEILCAARDVIIARGL